MSVFWLAPLAFVGLTLLAVPIAIHLLAQHRSQRLLFPTLRFLPTSQLAALRRRTLADWPLLIVRLLVVAAAVAAAAGPVLVSNARRAAWDTRVARAIVMTHESPDAEALAEDEARSSFTSTRLLQPRLVDAIRGAAIWLERQPPAAREVVVIGDLREGAIATRDLDVLPPHVGIRFLPLLRDQAPRVALAAVSDRAGRVGFSRLDVDVGTLQTGAVYVPAADDLASRVRVAAEPSQQARADALLRAVLREGTTYDPALTRSVSVLFAGADAGHSDPEPPTQAWMRDVLQQHPEVRGGEVDGTLVVQAQMQPTDPRAPALLAGVVNAALTPDLAAYESRPIRPEALAAWSRQAAGSPPGTMPADEGDRRWLWVTALLLLVAEQFMRHRRRDA